MMPVSPYNYLLTSFSCADGDTVDIRKIILRIKVLWHFKRFISDLHILYAVKAIDPNLFAIVTRQHIPAVFK